MNRLLIILFLLSTFFTFAQPNVAKKVEIDGETYYEHTVEAGNTLYGLQNLYNVSTEQIMSANPILSDGLKIGQKLLIPFKKRDATESVEIVNYKVKKSETLYGLSKKFNTSIDELIVLNPELSNGLQKGQLIKVPKSAVLVTKKNPVEVKIDNPFVVDTIVRADEIKEEVIVSFSDSTISHVVLAHETMYSVSKRFMIPISDLMTINGLKSSKIKEGQVLIIPVKNERIDRVVIKDVPAEYNPDGDDTLYFESKEMYHIAIMLPLHLDYGPNYSKYVSDMSTQFYMGAKLAIDSLEQLGLKARIHVFDTKNDSATIASLLSQELFQEMDVVFGPLLKDEIAQVANFCKEHRIRMVCPISVDSRVLESNRLVYATVASDMTLMKGLASHLVSQPSSAGIILVKPLDKESLPIYEAFRSSYKNIATNNSPALVETTVEGFKSQIRRESKSIFVVPSTNKKMALQFMNNLNASSFRSNPGNLHVFGMKEWVNFSDLNNVYKNKFHFSYASSNHVDYFEDKVKEVNKWYRSAYKTDLPKIAIQGYDVMLSFCSQFFLNNKSVTLLMNDFKMSQFSPRDGFENSNCYIIEQEDFELKKSN
tara:strand:- start:4596 stop:6383 length:1788 start_codon:yes stop_codon:yes gene_type:complete